MIIFNANFHRAISIHRKKRLNPNLADCFIRELQNNCYHKSEAIALKIITFCSILLSLVVSWLLIQGTKSLQLQSMFIPLNETGMMCLVS